MKGDHVFEQTEREWAEPPDDTPDPAVAGLGADEAIYFAHHEIAFCHCETCRRYLATL